MSVQHTSTNVTDEDYAIPFSTSYDAVQYVTCSDDSPAHYQPLDTSTTDYTSVYTTPTGRRGPPSVDVPLARLYSIVDPIKRDTDTTYAYYEERGAVFHMILWWKSPVLHVRHFI